MEIAVVVNEEGKTTFFRHGSIIKVYTKEEESWLVKKEMVFLSNEASRPLEIRKSLKRIEEWLEDCKLMVVKELKGVYFTFFEGMSFNIWEMDGNPESYLDYVYESEIQEKKKHTMQKKPVAPEEIKPGYYYINLKEVMSDKNSMTSKQILLPFFRDTTFQQLIIDCDHIPRWFEKEFPDLKLLAEAQKFRDGMKVIVTPEVTE